MDILLPIDVSVVGLRKQAVNERWQAMFAVYEACQKAGVGVPPEVTEFFGGEPPNQMTEIDIQQAMSEHELDHPTRDVQWFEVCLEDLPESVTHLRFVVERTD